MSKENLHPSVEEFKKFVRSHPALVDEVKRNGDGWQSYYEKWVLLGEDDPSWEKYRNEKNKQTGEKQTEKSNNNKELMSQVMKVVENVDLNKVEGHINQLNGAISNIQTLIGEFQQMKNGKSHQPGDNPPFSGNRD